MLNDREIETWKAVAAQDLDYHRSQFDRPYRSTMHLMRFLRSLIREPRGEALDVGCGAGANMYHLGREFPNYRWTGVDVAGEVLFSVGRDRFRDSGIAVNFIEGDFLKLNRIVPKSGFDLVLSIQTFLVVAPYEAALEQLLSITRGWLVITGLFTDFDVDVFVDARDYTWPEHVRKVSYFNVYSLSRLRAFCEARGARDFVVQDFEIDIDLPKPESNGLGSYTQALPDGRRLQFTGPIFQPWKFIGVRMGEA